MPVPSARIAVSGENVVLFVGYYIEDTRSLCRIAEAVSGEAGLQPLFWIYTSGELKRVAEAEVRARGFPILEIERSEFSSTDRRTYNPMLSVRRLQEANRGISTHVLETARPAAIVCTGDPARYSFLKTAARKGIPSLYLQWTEALDPEWHRVWYQAQQKAKDAGLSPLRWVRRKVGRRILGLLGEGTRWPVPAKSATRFAIPGEFYRRMYLQAGVDPQKIRVTGNPQCDEMHRCSRIAPEELAAFRRGLGVPPERPFLLFALDDFERSTHLDRNMAEEADATILRAMRDALPGYPRVVKLHPKQTSAHAARILSVDPEATVVGSESEIGRLIAAAEVVVCVTSSSLLWAMGIDRAAISAFLWRGGDEFKLVRHYSGVEQADSYDALVEALRRNVQDADHIAQWRKLRSICRDQMLRVDGRSADRIAEEIATLVATRGPMAG